MGCIPFFFAFLCNFTAIGKRLIELRTFEVDMYIYITLNHQAIQKISKDIVRV